LPRISDPGGRGDLILESVVQESLTHFDVLIVHGFAKSYAQNPLIMAVGKKILAESYIGLFSSVLEKVISCWSTRLVKITANLS